MENNMMKIPKTPSKRNMTLDLNSPSGSRAKRTRSSVPVLTTPDVQMLKMTSPEMAKFLSQTGTQLQTPTPSSILFPKTVTEEQELYAKGFEDALNNMYQTKSKANENNVTAVKTVYAHKNVIKSMDQIPMPVLNSAPSTSNVGLDLSSDRYVLPESVQVKEEDPEYKPEEDFDDEDDMSSRNSTMSPIDMDSQEMQKIERKRLRNRVAASKCRKRKLERIAQLDGRVQELKGQNLELENMVKRLKDSICGLKQDVMEHMRNGCQVMMSDVSALWKQSFNYVLSFYAC